MNIQTAMSAQIDQIISHAIGQGKITGACVGVSQMQAQLHYAAYGLADLEKRQSMTTDALFRMFSLTKPVTAVATMILWEQGKLELSDPVHWYFPSFQNKTVMQDKVAVPAKRDILIQDLLNMTSGIPYPGDCPEMNEFYEEINQRLKPRKTPVTTQEFAERVGRDVPLLFQPGESWGYGASADILGAILEKVANMPLDELYRKLIFDPLDMADTDFYVPAKKRARLAQLYTHDKNGFNIEPDPHLGMTNYRKRPAFFSAGAGLISTLHDYMHFANMLAGKGLCTASGVRLIGEGTWRYLTTPQLNSQQKKAMNWPQLTGYSYGNLLRVLENPQACMTNVPAGEFGWDGWTGPYVCIEPKRQTVFLYLIQVCGGSTSDVVRRLRNTIYGMIG